MQSNSGGRKPPRSSARISSVISNTQISNKSTPKVVKRLNNSTNPHVNTIKHKKRGITVKPPNNVNNTNNSAINSEEEMDAEEHDDTVSLLSQSTVTKPNKTIKTKPICITMSVEKIPLLKNNIIKLELKSEFKIKATTKDEIQVLTNNKSDKVKILEFLQNSTEKLEFHTFTERDEKDLTYVMKKHYYVEPPEMLKMLKDNECPATSVRFLNNSKANPSYIIHFPKNSVNLITLRTQYKVIDHCIIKWENFNNKKKKLTQCFRCQRFGHTARNCNHEFRCVKCTEKHEPGKCSRTTKEGNPKCVNCNKDHAANNRNCESYTAYKEKLDKLKKPKIQRSEPRKFVSTPAPWASQPLNLSQFPPLKPSVNYRIENIQNENPLVNENLNFSQSSNQFNDFSNIQKDFNSIPNISETLKLFRELTDKLKNTDCQKTRLSLLIEYTMK